MIASVLASLDPTVIVGGRVATMGGSNARVGRSDLLVVESDESDGSFLKLAPIIGVITNIDREHLDHYRDLAEIRDAFAEFAGKVPFYGAAIVCLDDENVQAILPRMNRRIITYGRSPQADLCVADSRTSHFQSEFRLRMRGGDLGCFRLNVPGAHNVLNAAAAVAVGLELDVRVDAIRDALAGYAGVDRRFQVRGMEAGVTVIDDYGHHPTEIRATLEAAHLCRYRRIHVLFQPHRYTRTQALMDDFARAFHQADTVHVLDIYAASEAPIEGVSGALLAQRIAQFGHRAVSYSPSMESGIAAVTAAAKDGDAIVTLGAGSVSQAGDIILDRLRSQS
jgi:UDP-N-acetylmuramate--alanine ligase